MLDFGVRTRVLLTRSPLTKFLPKKSAQQVLLPTALQNQFKTWLVRLACLIHAASVHPGPGSNPLKKRIRTKFKALPPI